MSNFLTRRHFARHFKYINKKLWPEVLKPIQNLTFHECMFQERHASTWDNYHNSGLHFRTSRKFLDFMGWKPTASRKLCEGSFALRDSHVSLQRVHLSTFSSLENDNSSAAEKCFHVNISDSSASTDESTSRTEMAIFAEKLQNCVSTEEILTLAESTLYTKPHSVEYLPLIFSTYQERVYQTLTFPWLLSEQYLRRIQLEDNFLVDVVIGPHTRDYRFQNLLSLTEERVRDISYGDCLQVLQTLHYLFITTANSSLAQKICGICSENVDKLDLHQLAILSACVNLFPSDKVLIGKIADATKRYLSTCSLDDVDLEDLCEVFSNVKFILSMEMFKLGSDTIIHKLKTHPSKLTLEMISKISLFCHISYNTFENDLIKGVQDIPAERFDIDISEKDLTIKVCSEIERNTFVCPIHDKLKRFCISEIQKATALSVYDATRYSVLLTKLSKPVMCSNIGLFLEHVKQSDNFLLLQLMRSHSEIEFKNSPHAMDLLDAYHQRFVKFFTSYNISDQSLLLWQNGGQFGKHLFGLMCKFWIYFIKIFWSSCLLKASGMNLNPCLISAFNNHFVLSANEWDASHMKIILSTLYAIEKLKSNVLLTLSTLATLEKLPVRLDFTYLMHVVKSLEALPLQSGLSPAVKKQGLQLKQHFQEVFESKLSTTNTLASHFFSNKILPYFRYHRLRKPPGSEAYGQLMDSIPGFLKDGNQENCLQALKIMYHGVNAYPVYQKETFETLIKMVTSSPKILVQPGLQLVKILAYSGYQTVNGSFTTWTHELVAEILKQNSLSSSTLVSLGYYLSMLGIFHDDLIVKIFSLDFLNDLEHELSETSDNAAARVKNDLVLFNRSVAIECPHLAVSWFGRSLYSPISILQSSRAIEELVKSVIRLTGDASYVVQSAKSPYGHHIDALMFFDPSSGLLKCDDVQNRQIIPGIEKIALQCPQWLHFCYSSDHLIGQYQADIRQLQILGYDVVLFTEKELSSMDVYNNEHLDNHVKSKINASLHFRVFKEP